MALDGCIVTIDAIGTQTKIAERIVERGADYVLAVKANQATLLDDILQRLPETYIIVAQVVPFANGFVRGHYAYNEAIPAVVASKGPRVSLVDMRDILSKEDFGDYYHPTHEGYDKMARAWEEAILQLDLKSLPARACSD